MYLAAMGKLMCLWLLGLSGCGSDGSGTPGKDFTCGNADRVGTYVLHATERNPGTCSALSDRVVPTENGGWPSSTEGPCVDTVPVSVTNNGCKMTQALECSFGDGSIAETITVITQTTADGSKLVGVQSVTVTTPVGPGCRGSYDLTYTRQ